MVAPFTGAWIEILGFAVQMNGEIVSLPSRERGLKFDLIHAPAAKHYVAPFTGAWIEIAFRPRK